MLTIDSISTFTGSGQLDIGVERALRHFGYECRTILYVEQNPKAVEVVKARIRDGLLPDAPIWTDVRTVPAARLRGSVGAVVGGFPCQDVSVAGKQSGFGKHDDWIVEDWDGKKFYIPSDKRKAFLKMRQDADISLAIDTFGVAPGKLKSVAKGGNADRSVTRSGLFFQMRRIAVECGAPLIFFENVPGIGSTEHAFSDGSVGPVALAVAEALAEVGYLHRWTHLAAQDVGAPHGRDRWWCIASLAHAQCDGLAAGARGGSLAPRA